MDKPTILVVNDDGIQAPGLHALVRVARSLGNVMVVAPLHGQSGKSHAITVDAPLRLKQLKKEPGYAEYSLNGTPVDCVKFAVDRILDVKPDLLVSGVNHGSNSSINVIYSGTMGATTEGSTLNIPSIGFSSVDYAWDCDIIQYEPYIRKICLQTLAQGLPQGISLNVNIPAIPVGQIKGIKTCRQAEAYWHERFEHRLDPSNNAYYWLCGNFKSTDNGRDTDEWALFNQYISVVPVTVDMTAHQFLDKLNHWELND